MTLAQSLPLQRVLPIPEISIIAMVEADVAVHDKKTGKFATDLTAEDFEVYEDGVIQEITNFSQETELPLTIALCVDTSSSVQLKLAFEKEAAIDFLFSV